MLLHLAATETYYQLNTFGGMNWDSWSEEIKKKWDIPMNLGEPARKAIKGNNLDYYLDALHQTREKSLVESRKRDDKWLATLVKEEDFSANNYAKWFHVAEQKAVRQSSLGRQVPINFFFVERVCCPCAY